MIDFVGRNQLSAVILRQLFIQPVAIVGTVSDQPLRHLSHDPRLPAWLTPVLLQPAKRFLPAGREAYHGRLQFS